MECQANMPGKIMVITFFLLHVTGLPAGLYVAAKKLYHF